MKKLFICFVMLAAIGLQAADVNYGNPKLSATLTTNIPAAGKILSSDGIMNYWGSVGADASLWSLYPATTNVNIGIYAIILGGVSRTNWPTYDASNWAEFPATTNVNMGTNAIIFGGETRTSWPSFNIGSGRFYVTENGNTSIIYHVTSTGHTNKLMEAYSD